MSIDTPSGNNQLHGTAMAAFQQNTRGKTQQVMQIQRKSKRHKADALLYQDLTVPTPVKKNIESSSYLDMVTQDVSEQ